MSVDITKHSTIDAVTPVVFEVVGTMMEKMSRKALRVDLYSVKNIPLFEEQSLIYAAPETRVLITIRAEFPGMDTYLAEWAEMLGDEDES